jgi:hypothetical protein
LTLAASVKHNGNTVETQQLRYRRTQETLQWDAAGNLTNDAMRAFAYDAAAGRKWTQQLNDEFIATMKAQGRQFQDIGPDVGRRLQNRIDPDFGKGSEKGRFL